MISGIFCIEMAFPLCASICAVPAIGLFWNFFHIFHKTPWDAVVDGYEVQFHKICHIGHIQMPRGLSYVLKELLFDQMIFSHILHLKRLSPVWTFWCCPRVCAFLKDSPHVFQEIDFCFVWTLMWYFNWSSSTKVLLQCWQENGLSPEWYFFFASQESLLVWMICCIV